jgi:hypothetical protein
MVCNPNFDPISRLQRFSLVDYRSPPRELGSHTWIVDEAAISVAFSLRANTTSLLIAGAMNDYRAIAAISSELGVSIGSGGAPAEERLPMHVLRVQGARAYSILTLLSTELTGLKALEASAALAYFPPSGIVKGKLTTDVFMTPIWRQFARQSVETWNSKRSNKLTTIQLEKIVEAWVLNRTARARRGLTQKGIRTPLEASTSATS